MADRDRTILRPDPVPGCRFNVADDETDWRSCGKTAIGWGCDGWACEDHLCHRGRCSERRVFADALTPMQVAALRWKYASEAERYETVVDLAKSGLVDDWGRKGFPTNEAGRAYLAKLDEGK